MTLKTITIVTGNPGKVRELQAMAKGQLEFRMQAIDLAEIQSLDLHEIVEDKLKRAYEAVKAPVIVDDVSAGLDNLKGLPGPFIKFFNKEIGGNSLWVLAHEHEAPVTVKCIAAYYDGGRMVFGEGIVHGRVVAPRGSNGFGFDIVIVPEGQTRTMAEMTEEEKMQVSHRGKAFRSLLEQLKQLED